MERFHEKGVARNISSCDLDQILLEKLVNIAKVYLAKISLLGLSQWAKSPKKQSVGVYSAN